ncbi:hypothetical protein CR513_47163, partial [Mucuna pruriens]
MLIRMKCKKQDLVSKSSIKVEYRTMHVTYSEIIRLCAQPTSLHVDNTSTIHIAANLVYHERTKHIEVDCHSILETYDHRIISLSHETEEDHWKKIWVEILRR